MVSRWAHNSKVGGSKALSAIFYYIFTLLINSIMNIIKTATLDHGGGSTVLQVGHSSLTSVQFNRHYLWKRWLQGVLITTFYFNIDYSISEEFILTELALEGSKKKFCKHILHSMSLF